MVLPPSGAWKLALAIFLGALICTSALANAPSKPVPREELKRLVLSAVALYAVGTLAFFTHHAVVAAIVYAAGIAVCALAAWLSRGGDSEEPPGHEEPEDEEPPPEPDGVPRFDWAAFEREFRAHCARERERAGTR
ncbi:MAG: hypothetical protein JOZ73_02430 [Solirubrobacterales bacterium]|nr:hypothetical protein [Solirubrobacterales bacterium]